MEPDYDWSFNEKWLFFGDGPDIPEEFNNFSLKLADKFRKGFGTA